MSPDMVESLFYFGEVPWHGLGIQVDHLLTGEEAIKEAGLDWEVIQSPVIIKKGEAFKEIPGWVVNVRESDLRPLGVVTDQYSVIQNREAFGFLDDLVAGHELVYETAGSLREGRTVWMLARIPKTLKIGRKDEIREYLILRNSHDGSSALRVYFTAVRVVCWNTLTLSSVTAEGQGFYFKHMGDLNKRVEKAREVLGIADKIFQDFKIVAEKLVKVPISDEQLNEYLDAVFPGSEQKWNEDKNTVRGQVAMIYQGAPDLEPWRGTAYAALNAVTAYTNHITLGGTQEGKLNSVWFGSHGALNRRALDEIKKVAAGSPDSYI